MNSTDIDQRPFKKRRFFFEDEPEPDQNDTQLIRSTDASSRPTTPSAELAISPSSAQVSTTDVLVHDTRVTVDAENEFDVEFFRSVVGHDLTDDTIQRVRVIAGDNMERAINIYFDGSWKEEMQYPGTAEPSPSRPISRSRTQLSASSRSTVHSDKLSHTATTDQILTEDPEARYIGAFGVEGWATRSGLNLINHGEKVRIERTKIQPTFKPGRGGRGASRSSNQRGDVITRFTNSRGDEIGRLPRETAEWVSALIDQKICRFTGTCVYAPDRIRVNDTIYLQIKCFILRDALRKTALSTQEDDAPRLFEQQETAEEKALRLRQVALVTLFDQINLNPTTVNETTMRHKREGLLRASEMAEQHGIKSLSPSTGNKEESTESEGEEQLDQDQLDTLYQKAQQFDFSMPEAVPGDHFAMELRKYQKQALHWMLGKERDLKSNRSASMHPLWEEYTWPVKDVDDQPLPQVLNRDKFYVNPYSGELSLEFPVQEQHCLGGILADEMGLGKTIEVMSLIHSHKPNPATVEAQPDLFTTNALSALSNPSATTFSAPYTTLVVAPTSLLSQWESEAMKASNSGSIKVLVYHGSDKSVDLRTLCCGTNPTGPLNLIITSYGIVRSEYFQIVSGRGRSAPGRTGLFSVEFFRVVLDEAHYIKNRASKTSRACCELRAVHRWALTGTPIVNRLEDLFSLVRFLKVEPWCNFSFWRTFITIPFESKDFVRALNVVQTVLEPLVLRRTKSMKTPEGEPLVPLPARTITVEQVGLSDQERDIYDIIFTRAKRTFNDNVAAGTLLKSYTTIFAQILRLRQTCCHPILTRNQNIIAEEEDAAITADDANLLKDDMDLQELIDRFTASTNSINGKEPEDPTAKFTTHALKQIQTESSGECPICSEEPMIDPGVTSCWHSACKKCLEAYIQHQADKGESPRCFSCRETLSIRDIFEVVRHKSPLQSPAEDDLYSLPPTPSPTPRISLRRIHPLSPSARTSAKIHALLTHLSNLPKNTKAVVFSQFTSFLDLIGAQLTREGIEYLRFDGTMQQKARKAVLAQFNQSPDVFSEDEDENEDDDDDDAPIFQSTRSHKTNSNPKLEKPSPNVLLISLRAGGVGLNLTAANHVYMMDPWWSFAVEAQAIDRVHRMGQLKDVKVTRFVVKSSIEERMLRVQERKMMIAGSLGLRVGDASEEERRKERIEELKLLFE
ncbi:DNA helicase rad5 [Emydomyces testavorans]|uniref:DNA helicase rad5 n=1 Tax=Emydomyces testavorans TaxID=2070801 RepID=A0AAF0DQF0_9EURO|nr:DNA helicase rad5 [Emydomyces testavorans]